MHIQTHNNKQSKILMGEYRQVLATVKIKPLNFLLDFKVQVNDRCIPILQMLVD